MKCKARCNIVLQAKYACLYFEQFSYYLLIVFVCLGRVPVRLTSLTICQLPINMKLSCCCLSSYLSLHMQLAGLNLRRDQNSLNLFWIRTEQFNVDVIIQMSSFSTTKSVLDVVDFEFQQRGTVVSASRGMS